MSQFVDFFASHYPLIIPMLAGALASSFAVRFYLNIKHQIEDLGKSMNERFSKSDERFVSLIEKMNERAAKSDERFANLTREMNEQAANLTREINELSANLTKEMNE